jgi:hypothetical protein
VASTVVPATGKAAPVRLVRVAKESFTGLAAGKTVVRDRSGKKLEVKLKFKH